MNKGFTESKDLKAACLVWMEHRLWRLNKTQGWQTCHVMLEEKKKSLFWVAVFKPFLNFGKYGDFDQRCSNSNNSNGFS